MLDRFDLQLLNLVQRDDSRTADSLASDVPLSPSAIARRPYSEWTITASTGLSVVVMAQACFQPGRPMKETAGKGTFSPCREIQSR